MELLLLLLLFLLLLFLLFFFFSSSSSSSLPLLLLLLFLLLFFFFFFSSSSSSSSSSSPSSSLPGADTPHVHVRAWTLCCFHSLISTQTFRWGADRVGGQLCGDKECPFSGVTSSGSLEEGAGKRRSVCVPALDAKLVHSSVCQYYAPRKHLSNSTVERGHKNYGKFSPDAALEHFGARLSKLQQSGKEC